MIKSKVGSFLSVVTILSMVSVASASTFHTFENAEFNSNESTRTYRQELQETYENYQRVPKGFKTSSPRHITRFAVASQQRVLAMINVDEEVEGDINLQLNSDGQIIGITGFHDLKESNTHFVHGVRELLSPGVNFLTKKGRTITQLKWSPLDQVTADGMVGTLKGAYLHNGIRNDYRRLDFNVHLTANGVYSLKRKGSSFDRMEILSKRTMLIGIVGIDLIRFVQKSNRHSSVGMENLPRGTLLNP